MSFQELDIKKEYRSLLDSVAKDFYIPLLSQAVKYQRAVGFFSSSSLVEISKGISELAKNGGKIQLVASPYLSDEDVEAIKSGYAMRDQVVKEAIRREMTEGKTPFEKARLNLLANLISDNILDIKIAFTEDSDRMGMYHEKMGIITDAEGNRVAFAGSMNESATAMTLNYESIDVFCSWKGEEDRVIAKENAFASIWNDTEPNIKIIDFPELKQEIIEKYKRSVPDFEIDKKEYAPDIDTVLHTDLGVYSEYGPKFPEWFKLHDYQDEAITEWQKRNYRGIFDMATGTGKTYTGLGALTTLSKNIGQMVMFMAQSVDIFQKSKLLTLAFELNIDKWDTMSETVKAAVSSGWQSIKYLNEEGTGVNSEIAQIPNDCGGIYIFLLKPDKIPQLHRYIMYIGRARRASNFSLRQRCARYINDSRPKVADMMSCWGKELYLFYLPINDSDDFIDQVERELIRVIIPPCNSDIPDHYTLPDEKMF